MSKAGRIYLIQDKYKKGMPPTHYSPNPCSFGIIFADQNHWSNHPDDITCPKCKDKIVEETIERLTEEVPN